MAVVEAGIYGLWAAKQTAKGSVAGSANRALIQVGGDFSTDRADGSEAWSDLDRFGSQTDYVDTEIGAGNPAIEAQPTTLAYVCWLFFGQETVTGAADPWTHTFTPGLNGGFWSTWWVRVGQNVVRREKFGDCRIASLAIEGSSGAKVVRVTPTMLSLEPGIVQTANPGDLIDKTEASEPFRYTEGRGAFNVNGTVLNGQSQFAATWDEGLAPYYGDDVTPLDVVPALATIGIAVTILADAEGYAEYNKRIYNTAAPANGTDPIKDLEALGSYTFTLNRRNAAGTLTPARQFVLTIPGVRWSPDVALPPNPDGGPIEISLAGQMRKLTATPGSTIAIKTGEAAFTA